MKLTYAHLKNFRSFKGEQSFRFPEGPGLYFMRGINEVEPRLGGNGVGKTTLWEALAWVVYGKTSKGLIAGEVCHWELDKDVSVSFDFVFDNEPGCVWTITRTWKPNSWTLSHVAEFITDEEVVDLTKDASNPILAALRLEFDAFLRTILMAQGCPMFLDLKGDAQASLFSNVLGLERWMEYAQRASKAAGLQDARTRDLEKQLSKLQGELEAVDRQDLSKSHDEWEVENMKRFLAVKADWEAAMEKRKKLKEALIEAEERAVKARENLALVIGNANEDGKEKEAQRWRAEVSDYRTLHKDAQRDLEKALEAEEHYGEKGTCPTCGQGLSRAQHDEEKRKARKIVSKFSAQVERFGRDLKLAEERLEKAEEELGEAVAILEAVRGTRDERERDLSDARRSYELQERELDRLEDEAERIEKAENPYARMAQEARKRGKELRSQVRTAQGSVDASYERWGLLSFWAKGFKEIRLQEIAEALSELEIEVNSAVTALGLVDWELKFQVDKEGKGGSITRGFNVLVRSPHNPRPTPWEAWSGGEAQRLRLAANMGLADLIRSRTGTSLNVEVWDEPTNGLSPEGIQDLLESLAQRAQNEQRQIWIVDHRAFNFGGFAGEATVVKAPSGSRIRTSW